MNGRFLRTVAIIVAAHAVLAAAPFAPPAFAAASSAARGDAPAPRRAGDDLNGGWVDARRDSKAEEAKKTAEKSAAKKAADKQGEPKSQKPVQVGSYGDWGAFLAQGAKDKTCYALATPKERAPAALKRDPAYVFISNRPAEKVRNEVSVIMGFAMKDGGEAHADIGGTSFDLIAKGSDAWIKNPAEESQFVEALKKGSKLIVKAPSIKGKVTIDTYSLAGISDALEQVHKDCP